MENTKTVFEITLIVVSILSIMRGLWEYLKQSRIKRKDNFFKLRRDLSENFFPILKNFEEFSQEVERLRQLNLEKGDFEEKIESTKKRYDEELINIPYKLRFKLLDHLEEIALMLNSRFIDKKLAKYMYGWVIEQVWNRKGYWEYYNEENNQKVSRWTEKDEDWKVLKDFFLQMKTLKDKDFYKRGNFKF